MTPAELNHRRDVLAKEFGFTHGFGIDRRTTSLEIQQSLERAFQAGWVARERELVREAAEKAAAEKRAELEQRLVWVRDMTAERHGPDEFRSANVAGAVRELVDLIRPLLLKEADDDHG